jgi:hypothetical protein
MYHATVSILKAGKNTGGINFLLQTGEKKDGNFGNV